MRVLLLLAVLVLGCGDTGPRPKAQALPKVELDREAAGLGLEIGPWERVNDNSMEADIRPTRRPLSRVSRRDGDRLGASTYGPGGVKLPLDVHLIYPDLAAGERGRVRVRIDSAGGLSAAERVVIAPR